MTATIKTIKKIFLIRLNHIRINHKTIALFIHRNKKGLTGQVPSATPPFFYLGILNTSLARTSSGMRKPFLSITV